MVVHCNGGKGRSATVIVATLIAMGRNITDSIKIIQQTRKGTIRNPLQQAWLRRFRKEWNEKQKRTKLLKGLMEGGGGGDEANSGADEESDLDSESDYDSEEDSTSLEMLESEMTEEDANKKLIRFQKRIESYEKKIEKRERALAKDKDRLEFYREEVRKVAGVMEKKGRGLKKTKSTRGVRESPLVSRRSPKDVRKAELHREDREDKDSINTNTNNNNTKKEKKEKEKEQEEKKEKKEEDNNNNNNHGSNNNHHKKEKKEKHEHKEEHKKDQEGGGGGAEKEERKEKKENEKPRSKGSLDDVKQAI